MAIDYLTAVESGRQFASLVRSEIDKEAIILLFGSCAKSNIHNRSDIDIAVISSEFGSNVIENRVRVSLLGYMIHPDIEAHAFSIKDWDCPTPFINEIKSSGVAL
jgi:predicted nucleotidyltransferase